MKIIIFIASNLYHGDGSSRFFIQIYLLFDARRAPGDLLLGELRGGS
jgi:hypothetical protein